MLNRYSQLSLLILTAACSSASSTAAPPGTMPQPASEPAATTPARIPPVSGVSRSWTITGSTQPSKYTSITSVTLELISDSAIAHDQLIEHTNFTLLTGSASGSTSFLGSIDAHSIETGARIGATEFPQTLPISFTGHIISGAVILDALNGQIVTDSIQCSNPVLSAITTIEHNIIILPSQLSTGMSWTDSTTSVSCSGTIPFFTASIRSYKVIGETEHANKTGILLERNDRVTSTGEGSQDQHRVLIRGDGTGSGRVYIDHTTGALLEAEGEMRTNLIVTMGKSQRFVQTSREKTTLDK